MIPLEEARRVVHEGCPSPRTGTLAVAEALGCVLASPAEAAVDVPPFANSAMDGYAVRAADVTEAPSTLDVVGRVLAGSALGKAVGPGQAARIMTGAPIPEGADSVCMVERTRSAEGGDGRVVIEQPVAAGENVRPAGSDVRRGEVVLGAGTEVGPTQLAALVSAGVAEVVAHPKVQVGVISTGDELVEPGRPLGEAQIYDSNRAMLLALVAQAGCTPVDLRRAADDEELLAARIEAAFGQVDALVLSGGVSVGDVDVVRVVLERLGKGATRWMQIAIRPAKPFSFAVLGTRDRPVPVFGLPGNPVSSAVSFELLVRPALRAMGGHRATERPRLKALAAEPLRRRPDGRRHFVRVRLRPAGDSWRASPCPGQGSHQIRSMALADGLAVLEDGEGVTEGEPVEVIVTTELVLGLPAFPLDH